MRERCTNIAIEKERDKITLSARDGETDRQMEGKTKK